MAKNDASGPITQHQKMARTGDPIPDSETFGIEPLSRTSAGAHPDRGKNRHLKLKERNAPVKHSAHLMPAQGNPDHGPTHYHHDGDEAV